MTGDDVCRCKHTKAWHMADTHFTSSRSCVVDGCGCQGYEPRGNA